MNKLNLIVKNQLPEFVREDYPAFVSFVETYYKWLEQQSLGKIETLADIDKTVDGFVQYFKNEIDASGVFNNIDNKLYLRHLKEFYASKGAPESFNFLFKVLFQKESTYIQPWDFVFKPSAGQWKQDNSILVNFNGINPTPIAGTIVNLVSSEGTKYRTYVNNVVLRTGTIYEVFIDRFYGPTEFTTLESISTEQPISGRVVYTTTTLTIERRGAGFEVGQIFNIESFGGAGTVIKVKEVDANNGIRAAEIISFGLGYESTFNLLISPKDAIVPGQIASISFAGTSAGDAINLLYETPDKVNSQTESGLITNHDYTNLITEYMRDPTYVGRVLGSIKSTDVKPSLGLSNAQIKFNYGCICRYPGYYLSSQNIIGDEVYVQDSYYYQAYSYVTSLEETIDRYSEVLKDALHPIGTMHFANYQINNNFDVALQIEPSLNLISKGDIIRDFVDVIVKVAKHLFKPASDEIRVSDSYSRVVQYQRTYNDLTGTTEDLYYNMIKRLSDTPNATDQITSRSFGKFLADLSKTNDDFSFDFNKTLPTEIVNLDENVSFTLSYNRNFIESVGMSDFITVSRGKYFTDSIVTLDNVEFSLNRQLYEGISVSEATVSSLDKYVNETSTTVHNGNIYKQATYVDHLPSAYWYGDYLENEFALTN